VSVDWIHLSLDRVQRRAGRDQMSDYQYLKTNSTPWSYIPTKANGSLVKVTLIARPLITPVAQKLCWCKHGVFTSRTCIHSQTLITWKSSAAVREAFSNAYPDKEVPDKATVHRLVTKFRDTESVCPRKHVQRQTFSTYALNL
jgi:hypothetical protein